MTESSPQPYSRVMLAARKIDDSALDRHLRVALGGNCNLGFMAPGLRVALAAEGFACQVTETGYDDWIGAALEAPGQADFWVLWLSAMGFSQGGMHHNPVDISAILGGLAALNAAGTPVVVIMPEPVEGELDPFSPWGPWRRQLSAALDAAMPANVVRLWPDALVPRLGLARWHASRYWMTAKCPAHPDGMTAVAAEVAIAIARWTQPKVRAVITDLDNTLWGGVVGEDQPGGLQLDPFADGLPFLHYQRLLKDLSQRGIPICVVSKNNPEDALRPFVERDEMILRREDVIYFSASWEPKHLAIAGIARQLSLGLDSICFLDDSPHERQEARMALPALIVPELPEAPEDRVPFLLASRLFTMPVVRSEDLSRTRMYSENVARDQLAESMGSRHEFLRALQLRLKPHPIGGETLSRTVALINKTNQFNLTNRRHGPAEVEALLRPENYAYAFEAEDRFGNNGIVGVLIADRHGDTAEVDTLLLSCRVLGRGIEWAMLEHFQAWRQRHSVREIRAFYRPSAKNRQVADLWGAAGLSLLSSDDAQIVYGGQTLTIPEHFVEVS